LVGVAKELFPLVYSAHLATGQVSLRAVAAVNDVEPAVDESGKPRRVPRKDFSSKGVDEFVQSIVEKAKTIAEAREKKERPPVHAENQQRLKVEEQPCVELERHEDVKHRQEEVTKLKDQRKLIAGWFYAIALFSIISPLFMFMEGRHLVVGLGITQYIDAVCFARPELDNSNLVFVARIMAVIFTIGMAALFALFGILGGRGKPWPVIAGISLYTMDMLIILWQQGWVSLGFHIYILWILWTLSGEHRKQFLLNKIQTDF
jgi:hypothetical protein